MKKPFQVGDRVARTSTGYKGTVTSPEGPNVRCLVLFDEYAREIWVRPEELVRLRPKPKAPKREVDTQVLENRVTHILSEWLNARAPIGEERYREPAKEAIKEVLAAYGKVLP